jgi:hypothetical protein
VVTGNYGIAGTHCLLGSARRRFLSKKARRVKIAVQSTADRSPIRAAPAADINGARPLLEQALDRGRVQQSWRAQGISGDLTKAR